MKLADKPGSVVDNHSSRPAIAHWLKQPTRFQRGQRTLKKYWNPIWSCSGWSLPRHSTVTRNAVRSYRTLSALPAPKRLGGLLSAALVVGSRRPDVIWHPALWSPDFPPPIYRSKLAAIVWPTSTRILRKPHKKGNYIVVIMPSHLRSSRGFSTV